MSHAADRSKESVARPARQAVPSASTVRVGGKRRGRPPLNSLKKAETARSRSPTSYISVNYEQPPTSDIRSRTETPAPSPLTSGSIKGSNSLASQSHEKAQRESGPLPESAASKVAQSDTITTVPSIDGERGIQLDPDSPVISRRPLPKLRGRSPSDIEPVLKPSTNSGIRTLPASSLPKDQKAFQLENQPPTRRAEPQPQTQAPEDVPPTVQPSASEKDLAASVPRASVPLTESVNANSSARPSVPLPKQAPPPPIHTGTAIPQTVPSPANPHHKEAPPGARSQGPGVHEKTAGVAALGTNVGRQVSPTRQQTSTKTAEPRTLGSLDRTVLKKILADAKGVLEDIYDITPNEEAQLAVILDDVVRYCQSLHNSTNPQQNLKVYPEKVQERLKAVSAGLVMLSLPTISEPASLREQRISAVALACRKAVVTVFACHKSREEQNKGTLTQTGTTAAASPIGPQLQASHEPRTPSGHHRHPQNVEQANSGDPSRVASQPKAGQLEPSKHPHLQSASQASQPHTSPGSSAAHPHGEPGRILAFPQETPVISPVDTRPQVTSASPALRSSNDTTNVQYISRGAVGPSRLSPVVPQHHTMVQSTSRTHSAAGTSVVSRGAVPANASQENRSRPMTLPGAQSGGSPITCSPFDRIPYHVQVAEDIPFTTAAPPPPPPASGPPLSMMEQLALDYARFG